MHVSLFTGQCGCLSLEMDGSDSLRHYWCPLQQLGEGSQTRNHIVINCEC